MATIGQIRARREARLEAKRAGLSLSGIPLSERYITNPDGSVTYNRELATTRRNLSPIESPAPLPRTQSGQSISLPTPTAPVAEEAYTNSLTEKKDILRQTLEGIYKKQREDVNKRLEEARVSRDGYLSNIDPETRSTYKQETRILQNQLDAAESASSTIQTNFEAKQKLIGELDSLLTQGNQAIEAQKKSPVGLSVLNARVDNTVQDVAARTGVIEAVLSARDGQIAQAHDIINQAKDTVTANWNDKLDYYNTLLDYNETDIISLSKDAKDIAEKEVGLIENDLERINETSDYIQSLMIDPESAQFIADAGVKLTDSVEEINVKMAKQAKIKEVNDFKQEMALKGYEYTPVRTSGSTPFEVGGQTLYFKDVDGVGSVSLEGYAPEDKNDPFVQKLIATKGGKPITDTFAQSLNKGLNVLGQIGGLQENIQDVKTGPILGAFRGVNPWDTNAQTIKAQLNAIIPNLARGVYGEVGVLTDNDIAQYSKTLPNLKSTEDIRNAVLGITVDLIGKSIKRTLEINAANGKDVSGFVDIYLEMKKTRDSIFSQIPGYKGSGSKSLAELGVDKAEEDIFDSVVSDGLSSEGGFFSNIWKGLFGN